MLLNWQTLNIGGFDGVFRLFYVCFVGGIKNMKVGLGLGIRNGYCLLD